MIQSPHVHPKKILVADDDPGILDAIQMMLEAVGYVVTTTADGKEVHSLIQEKPDLLLLDIWMSGQDGRDICKLLKANHGTQNIPIILISANKDTRDIAQIAGADDFVEKPFEMYELLSKVERYISNNHAV